MAIHQNQTGSLASYSLPAVSVGCESANMVLLEPLRQVAIKQSLQIRQPSWSQDVPSSLVLTPKAGVSGSAAIQCTLNTGGADSDLNRSGDNQSAEYIFTFTQLRGYLEPDSSFCERSVLRCTLCKYTACDGMRNNRLKQPLLVSTSFGCFICQMKMHCLLNGIQ